LTRTPPRQATRSIVRSETYLFRYSIGLDGILRSTRLQFSPAPTSLSEQSASFLISLEPKGETSISLAVLCEQGSSGRTTVDFGDATREALVSAEMGRREFCHVTTSDSRYNVWLSRSQADLHMMIAGNLEGAYPYAGVPWFNTVFGRDGILTAIECLWAAPGIARSVLKFLAETQATEVLPRQIKSNIWVIEFAIPSKEPWPRRCPPASYRR
jgi:glycogen debranching enzyme